MAKTLRLLMLLAVARDDAKYLGDGFIQVTRASDGTFKYKRIDPTTVVIRGRS
jgi:hypothetical protein